MAERDDTPIYDAYIAARQSAALTVAVQIGLFERLDGAPADARGIAAHFDISPRAARSLALSLQGMGLLDRENGRYQPSESASHYLVKGKPDWLGGLIALEMEGFLTPKLLLDAMRRDGATVYGGDDPWAVHESDPAKAREFTAAMQSISVRPARALADAIDFAGRGQLLDVGGGSGVYALAVARRWEHMRCTVLDLPSVCEIAADYIALAGLSPRVDSTAGDILGDDPLPSGYDVILLSQILHDWSPETGAKLLRKAFEALPPGGLLLINEKLVDEISGEPLANALVGLDMLVWTEGQQYSEDMLTDALSAAGFESVEHTPTVGYWTVTSARRA